jgi:hypothetical protein
LVFVKTYLIDGGVPAGIIIPPESGCRRNRINITIMTRHGKRRTIPSGTETEEFPFRRILRRKKANRGCTLSARRDRSSSFSRLACDDGKLLYRSRARPIAARIESASLESFGSRATAHLRHPIAMPLFVLL